MSFLKIKLILIAFIVCSLFLIYARLLVGGGLAGGDSIQYYSHLQSIVINHNLDFEPAYNYFHNTKSKFTGLVKYPQLPDRHPVTGRYGMLYPVGTIVSWLPFFLVGHLVALLIFSFTHNQALLSGFSLVHYFFTSSSSLFYLLAGSYLAFRYFVNYQKVSQVVAFLAVATVALGTSLTYYVYFVPSYSHLVSFFWSTWFLTYSFGLIHDRRFSATSFFCVGALLAMVTLTRYQDIVLVLAPFYLLVISQDLSNSEKLKSLRKIGFSLLAFALVFLPQFLINHYLHGSFWQSGYNGIGFSFWRNPQIFYVLFSPIKGLFTITPLVLISTLSLFVNYKDKIIQALLLIFFAELYLIGSWVAYHQGESYGIRMLNSLAFVFMFGLLAVFKALFKRGLAWAWTFSVLFIMINWSLMFMFALRIFGSPYDAQY